MTQAPTQSQATPAATAPAATAAAAGLKVSVIMPVFDEARLIGSTFGTVLDFVRRQDDFDFIFVDDGSSDQTADMIRQRLAGAGTERIRLISYAPNAGKGQAIKRGVAAAGGDLVVFMDGDLAYSLDHLRPVVEALARHDVVIGSRKLVHQKQKNIRLLRKTLGGGFNLLVRFLLGLPYHDTQAGVKGFRAAAARRLFAHVRRSDFFFDVELLYLAKRMGLSVGQVPARVSDRHSYKVSKVRLLRDPFRMAAALVRLRLSRYADLT